jgi:hypothetical protein
MADDLAGTLQGYRDKVVGAAKAVTGAIGSVVPEIGGTPPAPMPGRVPLGEVPKEMPKINTNTGEFSKKKF